MLQYRQNVFAVRTADEIEWTGLHKPIQFFQQPGRRALAESFLQHGAGILDAAVRDHFLGQAHLVKFIQDGCGLLGGQMPQLGHFHGQTLDLFFRQEFIDLRRLIHTHGYDHGRRFLLRRQAIFNHLFSHSSHLHSANAAASELRSPDSALQTP